TADCNLGELLNFFWSRIVFRLVALHCLPSPGQTDLHDLHADPIREIRGHLVHARSFLWAHEEWDARFIENRLNLERVAHAPNGTELDQFAVFVVRRIGFAKIPNRPIAEFRRLALDGTWRRLFKLRRLDLRRFDLRGFELRRFDLRWSRCLLVLYLCLQPA